MIRLVSAFCCRSWRILRPSKDRMQLTLGNLVNSDGPEYSTAWREFLFNDKAVPYFLRAFSTQEIGTVVEAGERWAIECWTTTRCAKILLSLTKVSLVSPNLQDYLHCFLYALVLVGELDVGTLNCPMERLKVASVLQSVGPQQLAAPVCHRPPRGPQRRMKMRTWQRRRLPPLPGRPPLCRYLQTWLPS